KGAVYTHGIFAAQVELLRSMYGIEPGEVDLPTFPLFGLFAPALGMTSVVPLMDPTRPADVDARLLIDTVQTFGVTNLFGSPALSDRRGRSGGRGGGHAAAPAAGVPGGGPGTGRGHGALPRAPPRRHAAPHALRGHRGPAGVHHRQRRDPGRNPEADRTGQGR